MDMAIPKTPEKAARQIGRVTTKIRADVADQPARRYTDEEVAEIALQTAEAVVGIGLGIWKS